MANQRQEVVESNQSTKLAKMIALAAGEKKAENVSVLGVSELTSVADFFVFSSAGSERQAQSIAREVIQLAKDQHMQVLGIEGFSQGDWILIDLGEVVFHVFTNEYREYYDLDGLWADATAIPLYEDAKRRDDSRLSLALRCEY